MACNRIERLDLAGEAFGAANVDQGLASGEGAHDAGGIADHFRARSRDETGGFSPRASVETGRFSAVHAANPPSSTVDRVVAGIAQHPPEPRGIGAVAGVIADDPGFLPTPSRESVAAKSRSRAADGARARGYGGGEVPFEVDVDCAGDMARAPGRDAGLGLAELEPAVGHAADRVAAAAASSPVERRGVRNLFSAACILPAMDDSTHEQMC